MTSSAALVDGRGCLTPAGVTVLASAPPGKGPPELAAHVVHCARCQARLLAHGQEEPRAAGPAQRPSLAKTLVVALALVALLMMAMWTLTRLIAPGN